jgi:uncharacterized LabA/DUF88 family protein
MGLGDVRPKNTSADPIVFHDKGKVFWHGHLLDATCHRRAYFTSLSADVEELHRVRCMLRNGGFDPFVIPEIRNLAKQREAALEQTGIIEKAKGVDISLAVQVLQDANANNFGTCYIFTSDVDYQPLIEAVRRMGKAVFVAGYREGLGKNSALDYVPDRFIDLTEALRHGFTVE